MYERMNTINHRIILSEVRKKSQRSICEKEVIYLRREEEDEEDEEGIS